MNNMIAYCGLNCESCPIRLAALEQDKTSREKMKASIARICSEHYGMVMRPEDITDCDGCRVQAGRLFSGSRNCGIRKCAARRNMESCAYCHEYACNELEKLFLHDSGAKVRLEEIRMNSHINK